MSETTIGVLIGAGATVAGSLVTGLLAFLVDSRRRRWEDERRWDEPRRRAYANFFEAARHACGATNSALQALIEFEELGQRLEAAKEEGPRDLSDIEEIREGLQAASTRIEDVVSDAREWIRRLSEASAEIHVVGPRRVRDTVDVQVEMFPLFLQPAVDEMDPLTLEQLRAMQDELWERWPKASEDFQQAVAEVLRVESHRALRRRRGR